MPTLWNKGTQATKLVEEFTVCGDRQLDMALAEYDVIGSKAHIKMLENIGLLDADELALLDNGLDEILARIKEGRFVLEDDVEDIHSQVELLLTRRLGDIGKKIHSGRSRNDQVLVDIKLFLRDELRTFRQEILDLFGVLQELSEKYKDVLLPGYTHEQIAMPSSFGMWFGAYAESLAEDMYMIAGAYKVVDCNPLGSAAGYGNSFPLDRAMTTKELGFETLDFNSIAAQLSRGKCEKAVASALGGVALTLGKFAADCCMYMCPNFGFISFPSELTTGSSIMPHKKNPDVFELIRAHCNKINGVSNTIRLIGTNLPSGYFRDMQIIKEVFIPMFEEMDDCLDIALFAIENMTVTEGLMSDPKYKLAFSVEEVNHRVSEGVPFRDAYKQVGMEIMNGEFEYHGELHHTHEGSIGCLCTDGIAAKMNSVLDGFSFDRVHDAVSSLLDD